METGAVSEKIRRGRHTTRHSELFFVEKETFVTRLLHNYVIFALQRQLYRMGLPFIIMPVRLDLPEWFED